MLIGGKIAEIPTAERNQERLRAAVDEAAGEIVRHYLAEMRGFIEVPDRLLFSLIPTNVLERGDLKRIADAYSARMRSREPENFDEHPFCTLYHLGLLGVVRRSR